MANRAYHRTSGAVADAILSGGFRDREATWGTGETFRGVWVTLERPWDLAVAGTADSGELVLLVIEAPEAVVATYEWLEDDKGYREALVPADVLNRYPVWRAWECGGCGAVEAASAPGWTRETIAPPGRPERSRTLTYCPECADDPTDDPLPPNLRLGLDVTGEQPLRIAAVDPETGERFDAPITPADLTAAYEHKGELDEDDE